MSDLIRREDALRVTLAYASSYSAEQAETAINALPAVQPAHVNETPKSEHDGRERVNASRERGHP